MSSPATPTLVEDVLLTDAFLIKGKVDGKFSRLVKVLEDYNKDFLVVSDAHMVDLRRGETIKTPRVHVNLKELILAHELVDSGSDFYQKQLSDDDKDIRIRAFYHGATSLEIAGSIEQEAYEGGRLRRRFFVMRDCALRGIDFETNEELSLVQKLPYAIVQRSRISYLYDFS